LGRNSVLLEKKFVAYWVRSGFAGATQTIAFVVDRQFRKRLDANQCLSSSAAKEDDLGSANRAQIWDLEPLIVAFNVANP